MTIYEGRAYVSSPYGKRVHPITGAVHMHNGKDQVGQTSKQQRFVARQGKVLAVNLGHQGGRGTNVVIQSVNDAVHPGADVRLRYQHQAATPLKVGQMLKMGEVVGTEGSTGDSTGSHCHFEVTVNGTPVDPSPWDGLPNQTGSYQGGSAAEREDANVYRLYKVDEAFSTEATARERFLQRLAAGERVGFDFAPSDKKYRLGKAVMAVQDPAQLLGQLGENYFIG